MLNSEALELAISHFRFAMSTIRALKMVRVGVGGRAERKESLSVY